jgi:hypothetical protein
MQPTMAKLLTYALQGLTHPVSVMKTNQLMTDIGTLATGSVIPIPHKTQKFTLWGERRIL